MAVFIQNREEFEQRLVIMKTQDGWSIRALARHFAVSRNMVRRILRNHDNLRDQGHDILLTDRRIRKTERASKLDSYEETLKRLLEKYPRITGQRLFEELGAAGYDGGISILRDRLRLLRPYGDTLRQGVPKRPLSASRQSPAFRGRWTGVLTPSSSLKPAKPPYSVSPTSSASPGGILSTSPRGGIFSP